MNKNMIAKITMKVSQSNRCGSFDQNEWKIVNTKRNIFIEKRREKRQTEERRKYVKLVGCREEEEYISREQNKDEW